MDTSTLIQTLSDDSLRLIAIVTITMCSLLTTALTVLSPILLKRQELQIKRSAQEVKLTEICEKIEDEIENAIASVRATDDVNDRRRYIQTALLRCLDIVRSRK